MWCHSWDYLFLVRLPHPLGPFTLGPSRVIKQDKHFSLQALSWELVPVSQDTSEGWVFGDRDGISHCLQKKKKVDSCNKRRSSKPQALLFPGGASDLLPRPLIEAQGLITPKRADSLLGISTGPYLGTLPELQWRVHSRHPQPAVRLSLSPRQ